MSTILVIFHILAYSRIIDCTNNCIIISVFAVAFFSHYSRTINNEYDEQGHAVRTSINYLIT